MWEKLYGLIGDNPNAKAEIDNIKQSVVGQEEVLSRKIASLQEQFDAVKSEKEKYKLGNKLVKEKLGLDKIDEDTLAQKLETLNKGKDGEAIREITNKLSEKEKYIQDLQKSHKDEIARMRVDNEISKSLSGIPILENELVREIFSEKIKSNIHAFEDGTVKPFEKIGDAIIPLRQNGKELSVSEYANQLLQKEEYAPFRKATVSGSAGSTGAAKPAGKLDFKNQTDIKARAAQLLQQ